MKKICGEKFLTDYLKKSRLKTKRPEKIALLGGWVFAR